ncbi:hypothetical protein V8F33_003104 [Rhypophila sp. PSN 637]
MYDHGTVAMTWTFPCHIKAADLLTRPLGSWNGPMNTKCYLFEPAAQWASCQGRKSREAGKILAFMESYAAAGVGWEDLRDEDPSGRGTEVWTSDERLCKTVSTRSLCPENLGAWILAELPTYKHSHFHEAIYGSPAADVSPENADLKHGISLDDRPESLRWLKQLLLLFFTMWFLHDILSASQPATHSPARGLVYSFTHFIRHRVETQASANMYNPAPDHLENATPVPYDTQYHPIPSNLSKQLTAELVDFDSKPFYFISSAESGPPEI